AEDRRPVHAVRADVEATANCQHRRSRATARRAAARRSDQPAAVFLDDLAVADELPAGSQVFDHVPVDDALVLAPQLGEPGADREVDRAVDLLVEERVPHVALDAGVAPDPELAENTSTFVAVERLEENVFATRRRGLDDPAAPVHHPHAFDLVWLLERREL